MPKKRRSKRKYEMSAGELSLGKSGSIAYRKNTC